MTQLRVAVAAGKGGVGKTTVACGIAAVLASRGRRVLVIDLDPQSNAAWGLGTDPTAPGTAELLLGQHPTPLPAAERLWVLPGGPGLKGHEVSRLDPEALADAVAGFDAEALIIDCPPGWDHLERLGLVAADIALVVVDAHPFAIQGATRVIEDLDARRRKGRQGARQWALVMSRIDPRRALDRELDTALATLFPGITRLRVRQDVVLALATVDRQPLTADAEASRGVADLGDLVEWLNAQTA